jgi:hypothetical protein
MFASRLNAPDHPIQRLNISTKADGGIGWTKVTTVMILGVENTHE